MLTAFGRAFKTPDLRKKLLFTLAMMAIFRLGFNKSEPGSQTMSGKKGEYTASVRCVSENQLVFFIIAGPSPDAVANYLNILYNQFGVM